MEAVHKIQPYYKFRLTILAQQQKPKIDLSKLQMQFPNFPDGKRLKSQSHKPYSYYNEPTSVYAAHFVTLPIQSLKLIHLIKAKLA